MALQAGSKTTLNLILGLLRDDPGAAEGVRSAALRRLSPSDRAAVHAVCPPPWASAPTIPGDPEPRGAAITSVNALIADVTAN